jgi:hypothetical protein
MEDWRMMQVEHCRGERCTVWVSPTASLTQSDIEQAQPEVRADGYRVIKAVLPERPEWVRCRLYSAILHNLDLRIGASSCHSSDEKERHVVEAEGRAYADFAEKIRN